MLPSEPTAAGLILKLKPQAKMPPASVLQFLSQHEIRLLRRLVSEPADYVPNDYFERPDADQLVHGSPRSYQGSAVASDDSGRFGLDELAPQLDREQFLFLRFNYCRRQVYCLLEKHAGRRLNEDFARELLRWDWLVGETRAEIVRDNVPLVLAMAKRTKITGVDVTDLISDGNLALMRAVNKFDCSRGYKFSTYACRAILKSFSRVASRTMRYRGHFPTEFEPSLERGNLLEQLRLAAERDCVNELRSIIEGNTAQLSDVEQKVIAARFALEPGPATADDRAHTLERVGELIGVTKERVRQIQNKALLKLRAALEQSLLEG